MEIQALLMDEKDNVVTCVKAVKAGEEVFYRKGEDYLSVKAEEDIPFCHKIALTDLEKGDEVLKYGELIGKTTCSVKKGHWVSHENIYSVPRDYESEFVKEEA
ncbi:MAG TPA: UxaA family hydrolase [Candidatus Blautia stercoripullorum]|mgnify:FL=1|uniref:UxaA family hydrolase n=1 Tax=Candidatus Blautia stercoripullorum TaxID=2838502 RepID=A0A9D2R9J3_9FIRM|nr:UxaA family hydrolase [Candidatus Blautia stercoripullorum]